MARVAADAKTRSVAGAEEPSRTKTAAMMTRTAEADQRESERDEVIVSRVLLAFNPAVSMALLSPGNVSRHARRDSPHTFLRQLTTMKFFQGDGETARRLEENGVERQRTATEYIRVSNHLERGRKSPAIGCKFLQCQDIGLRVVSVFVPARFATPLVIGFQE